MKIQTSLLIPLALACVTAVAQQDTTDTGKSKAVYETQDGPLVVHTALAPAHPSGPAPSFAQLDRSGVGYLTADDAKGYPLLANDFIYADGNRDGRISKAEYERWVRAR